MKKIIVIGCPGSGKSTFCKKLHDIIKVPLFHLDNIYWNLDKTTIAKDVFISKIKNIMKEDCWIIDGNYESTMELRLKECDAVFFLDYKTDVCINGILERKGKKRTDMPWIDEGNDEEFISFVKEYNNVNRPKVISLLEKYGFKNIIIFRDREEANNYLNTIKNKN